MIMLFSTNLELYELKICFLFAVYFKDHSNKFELLHIVCTKYAF